MALELKLNKQTNLLKITIHINFVLVGIFGTFIRYIKVSFTFALVDCVRYNENFVKSKFCSIHFTATSAGLKIKIVRYTTLHLYLLPRRSSRKQEQENINLRILKTNNMGKTDLFGRIFLLQL